MTAGISLAVPEPSELPHRLGDVLALTGNEAERRLLTTRLHRLTDGR